MDLRALADLVDRLPDQEVQDADQARPKGKRKNKRQSGQITRD
jgi:hypothetical protein